MEYVKSKQAALAMGLGLVVALVGASGCEDEDDLPQVTILSPSAGSTHSLGESMRVGISFSTDDFSLEGDCGGDTNCGIAYLNIDGANCNQPGQAYNNLLIDDDFGNRSMDALFELCPVASRTGSHTITISLRLPDGSTVIGEAGQPVMATITLNTTP